MKHKFFFLAGLPRSGSTLLSAILDQNPLIHAEGNSPIPQLLWDVKVSCKTKASEQLKANRRTSFEIELMSAIPDLYYHSVTKPYILDKCRNWPLSGNMKMLKECITPDPRIIVLLRPVQEIIASFVALKKNAGATRDQIETFKQQLLTADTNPILKSVRGIEAARADDPKNYIFITYDQLIEHTSNTLELIYKFFGLELYNHNLNNIINQHPEDDSVYKMPTMHDIRPNISRRSIIIDLSPEIIDKCFELNKRIGLMY